MEHAIETPRLILRSWRPEDSEPFASMNADPEVMAHFRSVLTAEQSVELLGRIEQHERDRGFTFWAVARKDTGEFAGFTGLAPVNFEAPFAPAVEIGWRFARRQWGHGFATEAARAALEDIFERHGLEQVVAFTIPANVRSLRVMEKLGMMRDPADDFDHPRLPEGHPFRRHVLYRISARSFRERAASTH